MFPSISHLFLRCNGEMSIAKLDGGRWLWPGLLPLDPPLAVVVENFN